MHHSTRSPPTSCHLVHGALRSSVTVRDATEASADELGAVVRRWAAAVLEAWAAHHGAIRERTAAELARR